MKSDELNNTVSSNKNYWNLRCIQQFDKGLIEFKQGCIYNVKTKFDSVDSNNCFRDGDWEIKDGSGVLCLITADERSKFFEPVS